MTANRSGFISPADGVWSAALGRHERINTDARRDNVINCLIFAEIYKPILCLARQL